MRLPQAGFLLSLPLAIWLAAAGLLGAGIATAPGAFAQGTVTPLAGQPRVTAPGGRFGRAGRRHRMHTIHARRGHHHRR